MTDSKIPVEIDEFSCDIDDKLKTNMMHIEKREFKHLSNINAMKTKKIVSAHSDVNAHTADAKYFNTDTDETDEKEMAKPALSKINSIPPITKKVDMFIVNNVKLSEKPQQPKPVGGVISSKYTHIVKSKSMKETAQTQAKEPAKFSTNIDFYPNSAGLSSGKHES